MLTGLTNSPRGDLDALAARINDEHRCCESAARAAVGHAVAAGRLLIAAKAALPHGTWGAWLRENVVCSERTAQLYMRLAREWPALASANPQHVADLSMRETVKMLASPGAGDPETDERYTPEAFVAAARSLMGGIDLDPATCDAAQAVVQASTYYTRANDGLRFPWHGRVWLNPPYHNPGIDPFIEKLIVEHDAGRLTQAVAFVKGATDARWFAALAERYPVLFTRGRVAFHWPDGTRRESRYGQALFGVGVEPTAFAAAFADVAYAPNRLNAALAR